jgi:hypothetical protein
MLVLENYPQVPHPRPLCPLHVAFPALPALTTPWCRELKGSSLAIQTLGCQGGGGPTGKPGCYASHWSI